MSRPQSAILVIAAPLGTIGAILLVVGCLATERDRGQALADGIRYVQVGCGEYLRDARIPRHPEADALCPVLVGAPPALSPAEDVARSGSGSLPPSGEPGTAGAGGTLHTSQGNAVRSVGGVGAQ